MLLAAAAIVLGGLVLLAFQQAAFGLPVEVSLVAAVFAMGGTAVLRGWLHSQNAASCSAWQRFTIWSAPAVGSLLYIIATANSHAYTAAAILAGLLLLLEGATWQWLRKPQATPLQAGTQQPASPQYIPPEQAAILPFAQVDDEAASAVDLSAAGIISADDIDDVHQAGFEDTSPVPLEAGVQQQVTRSIDGSNNDVLHGVMRVRFEPASRSQTVHFAFSPPLAEAPTVMAGVLEGPSATVKTVEAQTFGCSLEIRLSAKATEPCEVVFEFFASAPVAQEAA